MFVVKLALKNKMTEIKSLFSNSYFVGPMSLAITVIPWIMVKVICAVCLKRGYNQLIGKIVVITGASSGLGEALAHEFYKLGAQVVLCARRRQELERVRTDLLHTHCKATTLPPIIIPLDLNETSDLQIQVDKILSITGRIDVLVNNGGISHRGRVKDTTIDVDQRIMAVNYFGSVALTKEHFDVQDDGTLRITQEDTDIPEDIPLDLPIIVPDVSKGSQELQQGASDKEDQKPKYKKIEGKLKPVNSRRLQLDNHIQESTNGLQQVAKSILALADSINTLALAIQDTK